MNALAKWNEKRRGGNGTWLNVRDEKGILRHQVLTTDCTWCAHYTYQGVCSVCHDKVKRTREGIARYDAKKAKPEK